MKSKFLLPALWCLLSFGVCSYTLCHAQSNPCMQGYSGAGDPRDPYGICVPLVGRIANIPPALEYPNQSVFALGDINHDSVDDWAIQTLGPKPPGSLYSIVNLLIFHGKKGVLPTYQEAIRVGPADSAYQTRLIAHGDFDGDNRIDLTCAIMKLVDSSYGNTGYSIEKVVVFWGQSNGEFSISDTSELSCGQQMWIGTYPSVGIDTDGDGAEDICVLTSGGFSNAQVHYTPGLFIYRGHRGERWGRNGVKRTADWTWWNVPGGNLSTLDQDKDGHTDLVFTDNFNNYISVLYGNKQGFPDTTSVETILMLKDSQVESLFSDVTGDGIPELLVLWAGGSRVYIYAGMKGQRLKEQYGTGNEPPHPDSLRWWGKPWAEIYMAHAFNPNWLASTSILDLGDINLDGLNDICVTGDYISFYTAGNCMDSLIDGLINFRVHSTPTAILGNVLGDGRTIISNGTDFYAGSTEIPGSPCFGQERRMPHLTSGVHGDEPDTAIPLKLNLTRNAVPVHAQDTRTR